MFRTASVGLARSFLRSQAVHSARREMPKRFWHIQAYNLTPVGRIRRVIDNGTPQQIAFGLIGLNAAAFAGYQLNPGFMQRHFELSRYNLRQGRIWTAVTSTFANASGVNFLYAQLGNYFLGLAGCSFLGSRRFLLVYLSSGIIGSLDQMVRGGGRRVAGAGSALMGTTVALGTIVPQASFLLFGIVPIKAWQGAVGAVALDAYNAVTVSGATGHFGAAITGFLVASRLRR